MRKFSCLALGLVMFALVSCQPAAAAPGGTVHGVVYGDANGNGALDADETALEGVAVTLSDCGPAQAQTTDSGGTFHFTNLPEGTCHVAVSAVGWTFAGAYPPAAYPVPAVSRADLPTGLFLLMAPLTAATPTPTSTPTVSAPPPPTDSPTPPATATVVATSPPAWPMATAVQWNVNCRYGPGLVYNPVGVLRRGDSKRIYAANQSRTWWQIEHPQKPGSFCWVSGAVTQASGDLSAVPAIPAPIGRVLKVAVDPVAGIATLCGTQNGFYLRGAITANGPVSVDYHWEIWRDGELQQATETETIAFYHVGTLGIESGIGYGDCGEYEIRLIVTSPNSMAARQTFTIYEP